MPDRWRCSAQARRRSLLLLVFGPVLPALLGGLLGLTCREEALLIRPGCRIRVIDEETGLPITQIRVRIVTLHAERDTVGQWSFLTDDDGSVVFPSLRVSRRDEFAAGRKTRRYRFVAQFEGQPYKLYTQQIQSGDHWVRLSRRYRVAGGRVRVWAMTSSAL